MKFTVCCEFMYLSSQFDLSPDEAEAEQQLVFSEETMKTIWSPGSSV